MKLFSLLTVSSFLIFFFSCTKDVGPNPDLIPKPAEGCDTITFTKHIMPIFTNSCVTCHSPGAQSPELSDYTQIKAQVDGGRIKARVIDQVPSPMPLGNPLPQNEINMLKCWLESGAPNN
ncbi:MAG: hypothetical protein V4565_01205 [Bacteroidota bacterium]